jgi:Ca2+-binding EF-hand superfamily protein
MLFERFDKDKKGVLTKENVPEPIWDRISKADANGDGSVSKEELEAHMKKHEPKSPTKSEDSKQPNDKPAEEKLKEGKPGDKAPVTLNEDNNAPADALTALNPVT